MSFLMAPCGLLKQVSIKLGLHFRGGTVTSQEKKYRNNAAHAGTCLHDLQRQVEFKAIPVYIASSSTAKGYTERPCLKKQK